jgi:hypothetical protein
MWCCAAVGGCSDLSDRKLQKTEGKSITRNFIFYYLCTLQFDYFSVCAIIGIQLIVLRGINVVCTKEIYKLYPFTKYY